MPQPPQLRDTSAPHLLAQPWKKHSPPTKDGLEDRGGRREDRRDRQTGRETGSKRDRGARDIWEQREEG